MDGHAYDEDFSAMAYCPTPEQIHEMCAKIRCSNTEDGECSVAKPYVSRLVEFPVPSNRRGWENLGGGRFWKSNKKKPLD